MKHFVHVISHFLCDFQIKLQQLAYSKPNAYLFCATQKKLIDEPILIVLADNARRLKNKLALYCPLAYAFA